MTISPTLYDVVKTNSRGLTHALDIDGDGKTMCGIYPRVSTRTQQSRPQVDCLRCREALEARRGKRLVAKAAQEAEAARQKLEVAIREARAEKLPLRSIAEAAGMSHEQVRRISA